MKHTAPACIVVKLLTQCRKSKHFQYEHVLKASCNRLADPGFFIYLAHSLFGHGRLYLVRKTIKGVSASGMYSLELDMNVYHLLSCTGVMFSVGIK